MFSGSQVLVASGCAEGPCEVLEVLLMVANPHTCTSRVTFINDLKKSGLYVLRHVKLGLLGKCLSKSYSTPEKWIFHTCSNIVLLHASGNYGRVKL